MTEHNRSAAAGTEGLTRVIIVMVCAVISLAAFLLVAGLYFQHKNYADGVDKALNQALLDHAAALSYSRAWDIAVLKTSGMCFGFLMAFLGALYVLRTRDNSYELALRGLNQENTLKTSSPGLVMITLGVGLVATSILKETSVNYEAPTGVVTQGQPAPEPTVPAAPQPSVRAAPQPSVRAAPQASVRAAPQASVPAVPQASVPAVPQASVGGPSTGGQPSAAYVRGGDSASTSSAIDADEPAVPPDAGGNTNAVIKGGASRSAGR